jgi:hypothetical protein
VYLLLALALCPAASRKYFGGLEVDEQAEHDRDRDRLYVEYEEIGDWNARHDGDLRWMSPSINTL